MTGNALRYEYGRFGYLRIPGVWLETAFALALLVGAAGAAAYLANEQPRTDGAQVLFWALLSVGFLILSAGLAGWLHSRTVVVRMDDSALRYRSWRSEWSVAWEDIADFIWSPAGLVLRLHEEKKPRFAVPAWLPGIDNILQRLFQNDVRQTQYYMEGPDGSLHRMPYDSRNPFWRFLAGMLFMLSVLILFYVLVGLPPRAFYSFAGAILLLVAFWIVDTRSWIGIDQQVVRVKRLFRKEVVLERAAIKSVGVRAGNNFTQPPYGRCRQSVLLIQCRNGAEFRVTDNDCFWRPVYYHLTRDPNFKSALQEDHAVGRKGAQLREMPWP